MTLLDRYRAYRDDPYRYYAPRRPWGSRAAVGLSVAIVLVMVLNFVLVAQNSAGKQEKGLNHLSGLGYSSLLIPSKVAPKYPISGSHQTAQTLHRFGSAQSTAAAPNRALAQGGSTSRGVVGSASTPSRGRNAAVGHSAGRQAQRRVSYRTDANGYRIAPSRDAALVPTTTWLAHLEHSKKGYPGPSALGSNRKVPGSWYGYPSILPVLESTPDRLHVRLAQRPDEATSWITRSAVVMSRTHYAIVVDISQHWLYVFHYGIQQMSFPVGTGARGTPTPTGSYFLAFHAPPNGPGYGSVMLETSAHSRVISHFEGGNDAIIAIHGPIDSSSDAAIGNHGAAISNGCIRMHDRDLNQVRHIPNGAPIFLTD